MSSNLYNILSIIDSVCKTYQERKEENKEERKEENKEERKEENKEEKKEENKEEKKDNITYIRNFLNIRNINNNYDNNRNILSNIVENTNVCNMVSLFVTNYMDNSNIINDDNNNIINQENKEYKENNSINLYIFSELDEEIRKKCESCSICFENFKENEIVNITKCIHIYHENCINEWLKRNKTCPLCRFNI
jgi:hypothetical protein